MNYQCIFTGFSCGDAGAYFMNCRKMNDKINPCRIRVNVKRKCLHFLINYSMNLIGKFAIWLSRKNYIQKKVFLCFKCPFLDNSDNNFFYLYQGSLNVLDHRFLHGILVS